MPVLKNEGSCIYDLGGEMIHPGQTKEVSNEALEMFASTDAGKAHLKKSLKLVDKGDLDLETDTGEQDTGEEDTKEALLEKAKGLGLKVNRNFGKAKLEEMIAEAEDEDDEDDSDEESDEDSEE